MIERQPKEVFDAALLNEPEFGPIEEDDNRIYICMDHVVWSQPWRLADYGDRGPLSGRDIVELARRYGFFECSLEALSPQLGYCLDPDAAINLVEICPAKAEREAKEACKRAIRAAKHGDIERAMAEIADLCDHFPSDEPVSTALFEAKQAGSKEKPDVGALLAALRLIVKSSNMAFRITPLDGRKVWDNRRKHISWTCCYLFAEQGRPVGYQSTDDDHPGGPLIGFILDVMRRLTTTGVAPSPRTIREDIDLFRGPDHTTYPVDDLRINKSREKLTR